MSDVYVCQLFRQSLDGTWFQSSESVSCYLATSSLTLRDTNSGAILIDFPRSSMTYYKDIAAEIVKITSADTSIALKILDNKYKTFISQLQQYACIHKDPNAGTATAPGLQFPDLNNIKVQEFVLKLLLSDEFYVFVDKLNDFIEQFERVGEQQER